jgi:hypothetical protein
MMGLFDDPAKKHYKKELNRTRLEQGLGERERKEQFHARERGIGNIKREAREKELIAKAREQEAKNRLKKGTERRHVPRFVRQADTS